MGEDEDRQDWDKICKEGKVTIEEEQIDEGMCKPDPISLGIAVQPDSEKDCDIFWCQKFVTNSQRSCEMLWRRCVQLYLISIGRCNISCTYLSLPFSNIPAFSMTLASARMAASQMMRIQAPQKPERLLAGL